MPVVLLVLRVSLVLALALLAVRLLRSPAARRLVLASALAAALVLPLASAIAPAWSHLEIPSTAVVHARLVAEAVVDGPSDPPARDAAVLAAAPSANAPSVASPARTTHIDVRALAFAVWAFGALVVLARLALGHARAHRLVRRSRPATDWELEPSDLANSDLARTDRAGSDRARTDRAGNDRARTDRAGNDRARTDRARGLDSRGDAAWHARAGVRYAEIDAPAVVGVFRPVILVPASSAAWSHERRRAVLLHERAHIRQGDCLLALVAQVACALHWFNPLAWLAARRLRIERELAADAAALAGGIRATTYAENLVAIAAGARAQQHEPLSSAALGMASELETRIVAIVAPPRKPLGRLGAVALVSTVSAASVVIACAQPAVPTSATSTPASSTAASSTATSSTAASPNAASSTAPSSNAASSIGTSSTAASSTAASSIGTSSTAPSSTAASSTTSIASDTLDPKVQAIADEELARVLRESKARGGTIVVLDPNTGAVVAEAKSNLEPAYVTGSTLKSLVLAGALEDGVVRADERFDLEQGSFVYQDKRIHDAGRYGTLSVPEMLAVSSNVGFTKIFDRMGGARLGKWLHAFHIGDAPGSMPSRIEDKSFAGAMVAIGESATATPLQLAAAYAAIANGGIYMPPTRTRVGSSSAASAAPKGERILSERTTQTVRTMLEGVVYGTLATGKHAQVDGVRVAGKTGTAEWDLPGGGVGTYASFAGFAPSTNPRFVIVVGVDRPASKEKAGGVVAAPAFARVVSRALR